MIGDVSRQDTQPYALFAVRLQAVAGARPPVWRVSNDAARPALWVLQRRGIVLIEYLHEQLQLFDAPSEFGRRQQQCLNVAG
jgi:hypothetical protein